MVQFLAHPV